MIPTPEELLRRLGVDPAGTVAEELPHNRWLSPGAWQVRTGNGQRAVLKYIRPGRPKGETAWDAHWTAGDLDPHRWTYWSREPLAYQSGLPGAYAGSGITAPACLGAHVDDAEAAFLLEWVDGRPGEFWPVADFRPAAEALGRAQAPFLAGRDLPSVPWLSHRFLRSYSSEKPADWDVLDDDDAWARPLVRETFPDGLREGVNLVHANRERLYQISESLPRTLCHLDFWPKNLFRRPDGQWPSAVKYDWLAALTLTGVAQERQYRYGGGGEIDAAFKFRERSRALLFNAGWARQALDLADELGL